MNLFGRMFEQSRKNTGAENSSGGSEITNPQPQPAKGEIFFTDGLDSNHMRPENKLAVEEPERMAVVEIGDETVLTVSEKSVPVAIKSKTEDILKSVKSEKKKEQNLQKGDIFENTTNGETLFVEGEETRQDMPGILYTEAYLGGTLKNEGKVMWKPAEGFRVLIRGEEMKKNDPIKETDPEFYERYEEQMEKLAEAFTREFAVITDGIDKWSEPLSKKSAEERYNKLYEKIEKIGNQWNRIDDHFVEQGMVRVQLFAELRLLEEELVDIPTDIVSLKESHVLDEPDVELIEKGYQTILLEKKKEAIAERYNKVVDSNTVVAQDMPILDNFLKQINTLYLSMNEESSSKDIRKTIDEISVIERQMFVKKEKNNDENGEVVGGFVKGKPKGKTSQKQGYREKKTENGEDNKRRTLDRTSAKDIAVDEKSGYSPFITHGNGVELNGNTNTMPSSEIPKQEDVAVKADDVHNTPTAETAEDISWRAELDKFQEFSEGLKAVEKLKEMLVEEWGIFEQKLLDEAHKRDIRIFPDEVAKLWRDSLLKQLREMTIEYLNRYQSVPIKNGKNIFDAIVKTLEEQNGKGAETQSKKGISHAAQELNGDLSKEMTDSMLVRVKNHLDLNGKREKPAVVKQEQEKVELSNEELFVILAKALRSKKKLFGVDKEGKKLLIRVEDVSDTEIKYRYGEISVVAKPKYVKKFLQLLKENFLWTPRALQEKKSISSEEKEAQEIMRQVDDVIQKKIGLAKDIFENSMNVEKVSEDGYKHFVGYLNDVGRDAERFFGEGDIKGLQSILEQANGSEFKLEKPEDKKSATGGEEIATPIVSPQSEQEESRERTYEELEKTLTKIKRKSCIGIVSEGLTPYENERISSQAERPNLTLKDVVDFYGVDVVAKSFAPAVVKLLPGEWNEAEQNLFALEFIKREIVGCFE